MFRGTVIIDDPAKGGSDAGAWATHIAHTPSLRVQCGGEEVGARPYVPGSASFPAGPLLDGVTGAGGVVGLTQPDSATPPDRFSQVCNG